MSSLSVEQSKLTQQSTMKLGRCATWDSVSSINSLVSLGTGGRRLSGRGVDELDTSAAAIDREVSPSPSRAGVPGLEIFCRCGGIGVGCDGVNLSMQYERKSSSWSLRCGRSVENRVDVVRSDEDSSAGESDRVS